MTYRLHYISQDVRRVTTSTWSVYSEEYADRFDETPIDGSQQWVSRHHDEATARAEAERLQHCSVTEPVPVLRCDCDDVFDTIEGAVKHISMNGRIVDNGATFKIEMSR